MTFEITLLGAAIHVLIWQKLPEWGTWFNALLARLPRPLQTLYAQWHCAYCAGFWIALLLHATTGFWTIPALASLGNTLFGIGTPLAWFLDGLASAMLIYIAVLATKAIGLPAMKAHIMSQEFMK